jgi:iron complex transport system substrate-binding protein
VRIVSLLPSATEICFALGAGDDVVGVTFECDCPAAARTRRIVSTTALPEGLTPGEIDAFVRQRVAAGEDLYHLNAGALRELDPDVVISQDLCKVCAIDVDDVAEALNYLGCRAEVVSTDPHDLDEVITSIETIAKAIARDSSPLVNDLRTRLRRLTATTSVAVAAADDDTARPAPGPRVALLEWTDPPYAPGHWLPEMVTRAGGTNVLGQAGQRSTPITWQAVADAHPDLIIAAPCGFNLTAATDLTRLLLDQTLLPPTIPVWAVDANAYFARPGPRLLDGIETLTALIEGTTPNPSIARQLR